jgi:ATP-dependent HslUV protease ATP-binding subunit HslU
MKILESRPTFDAMTPRQIVSALDEYVIGQDDAKRAVAVAIRNRWRRQQLDPEIAEEVTPKNIIMIGPTGVGKTEIARRLAAMIDAPFVKVEASKFTEVGYQGRDVESMIRELVKLSVGQVESQEKEKVRESAAAQAEERLLDLLLPSPPSWSAEPEGEDARAERERRERTREKMRRKLQAGELDDREVELAVREAPPVAGIFGMAGGGEEMGMEMQDMLSQMLPDKRKPRRMRVGEARRVLQQEEADKLVDSEEITRRGIERAEQAGIVFVDEVDKVIGSNRSEGPDVSREGVQRDLLPIVEGTSVNTRHGMVRTDHILFIAAGAFHGTKPSDLIPELQGRFPIRVELQPLTREDFIRILVHPRNALTRQVCLLLGTEGLDVEFREDALEAIADFAARVNQSTQDIGARRLHTVMEKLMEEVSFDAPERTDKRLPVSAEMVRDRLQELAEDEDLSRYIL